MQAMSLPEGEKLSAALLEDESTFLDHAKCSSFMAKEHELSSRSSSGAGTAAAS
ncbi:MAG: hypothetical protein ACI89X_003509 [Planctomycetota bacterium]|jgi:hypothetical protein